MWLSADLFQKMCGNPYHRGWGLDREFPAALRNNGYSNDEYKKEAEISILMRDDHGSGDKGWT